MSDGVHDFETVIIGAGVVGLAVARALSEAGHDVLVVERHGVIGSETSSRNSEVIHAGIYYPPGSLKAQLCVAGKKKLYDYCESHHIAHHRCGKLIVATTDRQVHELKRILQRANANSVRDLRLLSAAEARAMEPELSCIAALHSPSTGIIDSHALMLSLQGEAQSNGCQFAFNTPAQQFARLPNGYSVQCDDADQTTVPCKNLVLSAGLATHQMLHDSGIAFGEPLKTFAKGNYFRLNGRTPFKHLIYPVPEPGGLGVHVTIDLAGQARFGPDVEWVETLDLKVDPERATNFYPAIRNYWPALPDGALEPDYAGIRPKLIGQAEPTADFKFWTRKDHGHEGLIALLGIESPGLTACLAIADHVQALLGHGD